MTPRILMIPAAYWSSRVNLALQIIADQWWRRLIHSAEKFKTGLTWSILQCLLLLKSSRVWSCGSALRMATLALCHFDPRLDKYKTIHLGPAPSEEGSPSWVWNQTMLGAGIQNRKLPFTSLPPPEVVVYIVDFWIFQYGRFKIGDEIRDPVILIGIISFQPWNRDPIVNQSKKWTIIKVLNFERCSVSFYWSIP